MIPLFIDTPTNKSISQTAEEKKATKPPSNPSPQRLIALRHLSKSALDSGGGSGWPQLVVRLVPQLQQGRIIALENFCIISHLNNSFPRIKLAP